MYFYGDATVFISFDGGSRALVSCFWKPLMTLIFKCL